MVNKENQFQEKAVIFLRVSSIKQEDGYSLDAQEKLARSYAQRNNLQIVKMWKVQESAWGKKERKEFSAMLDFVKHNDSVKHVIFDVVDRMTRNDADKIRVIRLIREYHKSIHFSRTNQLLNDQTLDSNKEFMMDVEVAASKKLSNDIAYKTRMGMVEKAEQGIYPGNAPLGYINVTTKEKESIIEADPVNAPLVTELFEYASTGKYSLEELEEIFYGKGLRTKSRGNRVSLKSISKMLHSPFYYGVFKWGKKLYQGTHPSLVSKAVWDKTQEALAAKAHRYDTRHNYPFNRLIICEHCGHYILGAKAKHKYLYYRCAHYNKDHKKSGYLTEARLAEQLADTIQDIELPKEVVEVLCKGLKQKGLRANQINAGTKQILQKELERANGRIEALLDMYLDRKITDAAYQAKNRQLQEERERIEGELDRCTGSAEGAQRAVQGLAMLSGLKKCYREADNYGKADLLRAVGAKFLLTQDNKIVVEYKEPFKAIYEAKHLAQTEAKETERDKKTALLNKGCLEIYDDKSAQGASKSCSRNYWGANQLPVPHFYPNPVKKIAFSLC